MDLVDWSVMISDDEHREELDNFKRARRLHRKVPTSRLALQPSEDELSEPDCGFGATV